MFDAVRLALGTLTITPTGPVEVTPRVAGRAMLLGPVTVAPLAVLAAGSGWLAALVGWPGLLGGLVVVSWLAVGTRALHLDGLADTVDGLGSGRPAAGALEVMRRGDVGPMGVVALVLVLGAQAAAAGALLSRPGGPVLVATAIVGSRAALSLVCRVGVPSARPLGLGSAVAGTVPGWSALLTWVLAAAVVSFVSVPWWQGALAVLVAALLVVALVRHAVRRLGGITGDVIGACVELALTVLLLGLVA